MYRTQGCAPRAHKPRGHQPKVGGTKKIFPAQAPEILSYFVPPTFEMLPPPMHSGLCYEYVLLERSLNPD